MCGNLQAMSEYTANVLARVWNDSADEEDDFGDEFDGESDEDGIKTIFKNKDVTFLLDIIPISTQQVGIPCDSPWTLKKLSDKILF